MFHKNVFFSDKYFATLTTTTGLVFDVKRWLGRGAQRNSKKGGGETRGRGEY